jgi:hypothetical protein
MKQFGPLIACILSMLICLSNELVGSAFAQVSPVALGGTLVALQQLKSALESTVNTVDAESAARINQLSIALDAAIKEVQGAIDDASKQVQFNENKVFSDVFSVM